LGMASLDATGAVRGCWAGAVRAARINKVRRRARMDFIDVAILLWREEEFSHLVLSGFVF